MNKIERYAVTGAVLAAALVVGLALALGRARGADASPATPRTGVVVVRTNLAYEDGGAAGTGIVLTSSGEVLTNNHVIRGATSVQVVDAGHTYSARVVGYSVTKDVAVLQLANAHGLKTASIGNSSTVKDGQSVTAVGNAGGTGYLTTVTGRVTALGRAITVSDEQGDTNRLDGMIQTTAPLQPGDSGGPLLHAGRVIGIDSAASTGFQMEGATEGFAIPINTAVSLAKQIEAGRRSATVHVGPTAFLGVALSTDEPGAVVAQVVPNSAADQAGIQPGDQITVAGGRTINSGTDLQHVMLQASPGSPLTVVWTDGYGDQNSATVRPAAGPPQ